MTHSDCVGNSRTLHNHPLNDISIGFFSSSRFMNLNLSDSWSQSLVDLDDDVNLELLHEIRVFPTLDKSRNIELIASRLIT